MKENNMEFLVSHAINSYTNNLLVLYSAHKLKNDIAVVLESEVMNTSFEQYLQQQAQVFKTEALLIQNLLLTERECIKIFQEAYNDLKHDIAGNYEKPGIDELREINDKIIAFAKKRKQSDRWNSLYIDKKDAA